MKDGQWSRSRPRFGGRRGDFCHAGKGRIMAERGVLVGLPSHALRIPSLTPVPADRRVYLDDHHFPFVRPLYHLPPSRSHRSTAVHKLVQARGGRRRFDFK